jgi:ATP-dependent DNA helicase RecG
MITITLSDDNTTAYISPCRKHGLLYTELENLGGFNEAPTQESMTVPLSSNAALGLRKVMTGKPLSIEPHVGKILGSLADSTPPKQSFHVFPSWNKNNMIVDTQSMSLSVFAKWRTFWTKNPDKVREITDGVFLVSLSSLIDIADSFPEFRISPALENPDVLEVRAKIPAKPERIQPDAPEFTFAPVTLPDLPPFDGYDGSLLSLRSVPLSAYEYIRNDSEKVAKANARSAGAGKKKKTQRSLLQKLTAIGVESAFDLLHYFPLRHIDRSKPQLIRSLSPGDEATVVATIADKGANYEKNYVFFVIEDAAGSRMRLTLFNQTWMIHNFSKGDEVIVHGKFSPFNGSPSIAGAKIDKVGDIRGQLPLIPVYPQSGKQEITTWDVLALVKETLGRIEALPLSEPLGAETLERYQIPDRNNAYRNIHIPDSKDTFKDANRRLIYEELLRLQLYIQQQKNDATRRIGIAQNAVLTPSLDAWKSRLPYELTNAQKRATEAIKENMASASPMHRLVQGDVGAGKSSVASFTVFLTVDNGHQAALLAPTEILAEQLHNGIAADAEGLISPRTGELMNVKFLGGKTRAKEAREIRAALASGEIDVIVGTHAILTEETVYADLGTVVIDEQHRFGVEQRTRLRNARHDGLTPDMLVMTATPIPRSSAMVLYGDLDITVLDELPPGRTPIETIWVREEAQQAIHRPQLDAWNDIKQQVADGHQAYIVASLVEDNEKIAAQSVEDAYEALSGGIFAGYRMGMVHGKQKRDEREEIMKKFAAGEIDILVSTTVIEVGVNVPNSTIMVVLDPGRFGIAQLHQIRGRVGRSKFASRCYLIGDTKTEEGEFRLNALVESTDGFYLSEKDLELRGEGTLFSTKQSGQSDLYLAKIREHLHILEIAKEDAVGILAKDPNLQSETGKLFAGEITEIFGEKDIKS